VSRRETGEPPGRPCRDEPRSVPCARDESPHRDPRDFLRTPPRCDAPRTHARPRPCGTVESFPFVLPSPLPPSLALPPPSIATHLVRISHPSADAQPHRRIERSRRLRQSLGRHDKCTFRLEIPRKGDAKDAGQQLAVFKRRDHKPALKSSFAGSTHPRRTMPAVDCIHDVGSLYVSFS